MEAAAFGGTTCLPKEGSQGAEHPVVVLETHLSGTLNENGEITDSERLYIIIV